MAAQNAATARGLGLPGRSGGRARTWAMSGARFLAAGIGILLAAIALLVLGIAPGSGAGPAAAIDRASVRSGDRRVARAERSDLDDDCRLCCRADGCTDRISHSCIIGSRSRSVTG
jgi:hypothetical protein